jgi:hypothetical protein
LVASDLIIAPIGDLNVRQRSHLRLERRLNEMSVFVLSECPGTQPQQATDQPSAAPGRFANNIRYIDCCASVHFDPLQWVPVQPLFYIIGQQSNTF